MQIIFLDLLITFFVDILAWVVFHLGISFTSSKISLSYMHPEHRFFRTYTWEKEGLIYEKIFHVHSWKHVIPNGSAAYRGTFSIKNLPAKEPA